MIKYLDQLFLRDLFSEYFKSVPSLCCHLLLGTLSAEIIPTRFLFETYNFQKNLKYCGRYVIQF